MVALAQRASNCIRILFLFHHKFPSFPTDTLNILRNFMKARWQKWAHSSLFPLSSPSGRDPSLQRQHSLQFQFYRPLITYYFCYTGIYIHRKVRNTVIFHWSPALFMDIPTAFLWNNLTVPCISYILN